MLYLSETVSTIQAGMENRLHANHMAPRMRFRFRKSFNIFGKFLGWTVSKKGVSLNMKLGPLSKSWGTRGRTTTIDAPGEYGMFWRKQESRKASAALTQEEKDKRAEGFWKFYVGFVLAIQLMAELVWVNASKHTGDVNGNLALLFIVELALIVLLWTQIKAFRSFVGLLGVLIIAYVHWRVVGSVLL